MEFMGTKQAFLDHIGVSSDMTTEQREARYASLGLWGLAELIDSFASIVRTVREKRTIVAIEKAIPRPIAQSRTLQTHVFLTVNPDPAVSLERFVRQIHKLAKRDLWKSGLYCFEQRGGEGTENPMGHGFHCHMLMERNCVSLPAKQHKLRARTTCKDLCNVKQNSVFNWYECPPQFRDDKRAYILGDKGPDPFKALKCKADIPWRLDNNLEPSYII